MLGFYKDLKAITDIGNMLQMQAIKQQGIRIFEEWLCVQDQSHAT